MTDPHEVVPFDPAKTMDPGGPPNGSSANWPGVAQEVVRQGGGAIERHQVRTSSRAPRPRASMLSIANAVGLGCLFMVVILGSIAAAVIHQLGAESYEARQLQRHDAVMENLRAQREATYMLIDAVAVHHPEAAKVGTKLQRDTVPK